MGVPQFVCYTILKIAHMVSMVLKVLAGFSDETYKLFVISTSRLGSQVLVGTRPSDIWDYGMVGEKVGAERGRLVAG